MIEYVVDDRKFILSYIDLREHYIIFCQLNDDEFIKRLSDAIHLACAICYLKENPTYICLSDTGVIHELVHLLKDGGTTTSLRDIRALFEQTLKLC